MQKLREYCPCYTCDHKVALKHIFQHKLLTLQLNKPSTLKPNVTLFPLYHCMSLKKDPNLNKPKRFLVVFILLVDLVPVNYTVT